MKEREKQQAIENKRLKELKTVRKMIEIYCKGQHRRKSGDLCESCAELMHLCRSKGRAMPTYGRKKHFVPCAKHTVMHRPIGNELKEVMRYSGPRMLWIHPIMTIRHILLGKGLLK